MERTRNWLPIIGALGSYRRAWLMRDAVAAVTICAVLVPQALAYGQLAGLSPVDGLYAALAPLILYPLFASSRRLMVGPESGLAILTAVALAPLAAVGSVRFAVLAAMLALLTGAVLILAGVVRLGFLADFFSRPVLIGFINGVAVIIIVTQLPRFLGIKVRTDSTLGTLWQVVTHIGDAQWRTIVLGFVLLIVLALLATFRAPPSRARWSCWWSEAPRLRGSELDSKGVAVIGVVPAGLPGADTAACLAWRYRHAGADGRRACLCWLCALDPHRASVRRAPRRSGRRQSGARRARRRQHRGWAAARLPVVLEPVPHGRRRDRRNAGPNSRRSEPDSWLSAFLLWLTGVLHDVPTVALAAIVIFAAAGLFDVGALTRLYRQDRPEFAVAIVTFAGVVVLGMLVGILTAVFLSLALLIARISRPRAVVIGALDGAEGFHELAPGQGLEAARGVVVYRFDAPLFFGNADYFVEQAVEVFDQATPRRLVLDLEAVTFIDVTAARALKRLLAHVKIRRRRAVHRADQTTRGRPDEGRRTRQRDRRGPRVPDGAQCRRALAPPPGPADDSLIAAPARVQTVRFSPDAGDAAPAWGWDAGGRIPRTRDEPRRPEVTR